ncbi:LexA family transcriptional regulator [uncultured Candidatus Kuenenia sp.]|uniref:LexA family transcriptional regulator n=1 Tax=uncultured Candidatus Kuenenia sp. TaxID=1048336 RepID=UPI0025E1A235|nr:LexA family transcriptional regulator [uncultured Candidatus Kuenenia sp.]
MSLREASKLSGVSNTHIRDIEDGRSVPSFEMVMNFLSAYGVDIEMFLRETEYLSSRGEPEGLGAARRVPVISWAQAGNWQELCANFQYGGHEEYVETDSKGFFALKVRGRQRLSN